MDPVRIVHLSDLHFVPGKDMLVWNAVRDFINQTVKPHAVLITGDVTDSAEDAEFALAAQCLNSLQPQLAGGDSQKFRIVAGNHDRFLYRGNQPPFGIARLLPSRWPRDKQRRFDGTFQAQQVPHNAPCDLTLCADPGSPHGITWKIRLLGLDSSADQKWFAQGHVNPTHIHEVCQSAAKAQDFDLVIALVHHHVLPIPSVEERKGQLEKLIDATGLLNSGTLMAALSRNQIDLVLHGHEHAPHQARFAGADELATDVALVSAGSTTGDETLKGWNLNRVHFNVIELDPDRSVWLRQVEGKGAQLRFRPGRKALMTSTDLRLSRFIRRNRNLGDQAAQSEVRDLPRSRLRKTIEFKANRDVEVTESRTDWLVSPQWQQLTSNGSGFAPEEAVAHFEWADGGLDSRAARISKVSGSHDEHCLDFSAPNRNLVRQAKCVNVRWKWTAAAVYTQAELDMLPDTARQGPRREGREFASVLCHDEVKELILTVKLPSYFSPKPEDVEVYYEHPSHPGDRQHAAELKPFLDVFGAGNLELRIRYPMPGYRYGVSWRVTDDKLDAPSLNRRLDALEKEAAAIQAFMRTSLQSWSPDAQPRWDIYRFQPAQQAFVRLSMGDDAGSDVHPIRDARGLIRAAAWGDAIVVEKDLDNGRHEFHDAERVVSYLPLLRRDSDFGFAPALLRLSFVSNPLGQDSLRDWLEEAKFFTAKIALLVAHVG